MGFLNRMKGVFSTGQASAVNEARPMHKGGDIAGSATENRRKIVHLIMNVRGAILRGQ